MESFNKSYAKTLNMIYLVSTEMYYFKKTTSILFNEKDP